MIVALVQIDLSSHPAPLMRVSVVLPRRANLSNLFISPDGERLIWHLVFNRSRLSEPRLSRKSPFVDFETDYNDALWVSKIDGSQMREVGHVKPYSKVSTVGWTPDGQHFSFVYLNLDEEPFHAFWTVPVQ